jgi:CRP/FNR family transcriptional regulator, polysaccharide utilization system transcription regulator
MQFTNPYIEVCLEGPSSVFRGLNQKEKEIIDQNHTLSHFKRNTLLFSDGEKSHGLICLASGAVKLFKEGVGSRQQIVKMVRPQGLIGYRALFSDHPWSVSASAIEDSVICILEKSSLVKILKRNPDLGLKFIKLMSEELIVSNNRTVSLSQKHVRGRVAESLLLLRETYGCEEDGKTIRIALSREDMANLSNMTTSNAIRTLSNMATERLIAIKGRKISILSPANLKHISEAG